MIKRSAISFLFSTGLILGAGAAAGAQNADDCQASPLPPTCVPPTDVLPSAPETAAPTTPAAPVALPKQTLPVTGTETAGLALGGIALVAAGGALVWRSNKVAA